ncbi:MAG: hypothetical protein SPF04_02445 [Bacilli bacterium]|nr:hypothetical protein [Bacilli bacterium]
MTVNEEREVFLRTISSYFKKNSNIPLEQKNIYSYLVSHTIKDGYLQGIPRESLVNVQLHLNEKYKGLEGINTFTGPKPNNVFWVIENRGQMKDKNFYEDIKDSIKLYLPVDASNIYEVSTKVLDYIIKEGIHIQAKIAKNIRSDVFVIRVLDKDKLDKLLNYINSLDYNSKSKPNPFALNVGRVSITKDGMMSYNTVLAEYITEYLKSEREEVTLENFKKFMHKQINKIPSSNKNKYMIVDLIIKNLENTLTLEELLSYNQKVVVDNRATQVSEEDKNNILRLINGLNVFYNLEETHKRIEMYLATGNINYFTRQNGIRKFVEEYLPVEQMRTALYEMGWSALVNSIDETYKKYGELQVIKAVERIVDVGSIEGLTNTNNTRSYLGFITSPELLQKIILKQASSSINIENQSIENIAFQVVGKAYEEIEYKNKQKKNGRN